MSKRELTPRSLVALAESERPAWTRERVYARGDGRGRVKYPHGDPEGVAAERRGLPGYLTIRPERDGRVFVKLDVIGLCLSVKSRPNAASVLVPTFRQAVKSGAEVPAFGHDYFQIILTVADLEPFLAKVAKVLARHFPGKTARYAGRD